jgi:hypothetical protein
VETPIISYRKKFKTTTSVRKVMATVFWDLKRLLLVDFIHKSETINAYHYIQALQKLRQAVRRKRVGMLTRGVKLLHDNATPHTAGKTRETIEKMGWEILKHPLTALTSHRPTSICLES